MQVVSRQPSENEPGPHGMSRARRSRHVNQLLMFSLTFRDCVNAPNRFGARFSIRS
jgi:hypothetical protein